MPEAKGKVTQLITTRDGTIFGVKMGTSEYVFSKPDYRSLPFEEPEVGDIVRVEYNPSEDKRTGKPRNWVSVIEILALPEEQADEPPWEEDVEPAQPAARETGPLAWSYQSRDIIMFVESCAKCASSIYAAALTSGAIREIPKSDEVTTLARAIERHGVERFKALMEEL